LIFFHLYLFYAVFLKMTSEITTSSSRTVAGARLVDVSWRWWPGKTFEEEWDATAKACGARAMVVKKYYPDAFDRMGQYGRGRLCDVQLPKTKSSRPNAQPMFCDSCILSRENHCIGFTYCVEHKHHTGQRFWFCDDCSNCYHERLSQGKNIHFDEKEWEKEEWEKEEWIEVTVVTEEVFQSLQKAL